MRRLLAVFLSLSVLLILSGCGHSGKTLSQRIEELENFKLPGLRDEATVQSAADAVAGGEDAEGLIAGAAGLTESGFDGDSYAPAQVEELFRKEQMIQELVGEWSELSEALPLFRPIVSWFGNLVLAEDGSYRSETTTGTWELDSSASQITLYGSRGKTLVDIVEDGSYLKLNVPELHLNFLRSGELEHYIDERFVFVEISEDNVRDYISKPVNIGVILDEKEKPTGECAWVLGSEVYADGLVYYGRSEDFSFVLQNNATGTRSVMIPYDTLSLTTGASFGHFLDASGTLVFIRQKYVSDNRMTDARTRTLTFTDGTTHTTSLTWYSDLANYGDWMF